MAINNNKQMNVLKSFAGCFERDSIEAALAFASYLHRGKNDKGGIPYILHPVWIAQEITRNGGSIDEQIVALLHDTVEDTCITLSELAEWFNSRIIAGIDAMTKREGEGDDEYMARVAINAISRKVKRYDLIHNMDVRRLKNRTNLQEKDLLRIKKYAKMYDFLVGGAIGV